jgi:hypothetical protein
VEGVADWPTISVRKEKEGVHRMFFFIQVSGVAVLVEAGLSQ